MGHHTATASSARVVDRARPRSTVHAAQLKDTAVSVGNCELGSVQLKALRASPLYSPQSARPRAASQRSTSTHKACPFETTFDHKERRFPMYNGDRRPHMSAEFRHLDTIGEEDDLRLTAELENLYEKLLPSPEDTQRKHDLVEKLERLLNHKWPGNDFTVHAFGSTENMLATRNSDLDVCIETEWTDFGQQIVDQTGGMHKVVCRAQAKVPVVTIYDPELMISCDMNINNMLALRNTKLVKTYVQVDERARKLIFAIKQWASNRALNDAVCNTLTSYTWTLLIINYLQTRRLAPVLPSLQEWPHEPLPLMDGVDVSFADDVVKYDTLQTFSLQNPESIGSLFFGFFHYYSYEFNYNRDVASVRCGSVLVRRDKGYPSDNMFCIEEPFTISRNLGNTADMGSFKGIHQELQRAHKLLCSGEALDVVIVKYDASKVHNIAAAPRQQTRRSPTGFRKNYSINNQRHRKLLESGADATNPNQNPVLRTTNAAEARRSRRANAPSGFEGSDRRLSHVEHLHWQYLTMAEHNRLVLSSNPYVYPAQILQYAQSYCSSVHHCPAPMQRAKSLPVDTYNPCGWSSDTMSRFNDFNRSPRYKHTAQSGFYNHGPQFSVSEPELSRISPQLFSTSSSGDDLALALGLSKIEMIPQLSHSKSLVNHENLFFHDASHSNTSFSELSFSDAGDSQSSIGMTLSTSRSSPDSMLGDVSTRIPTYAQVSNGNVDCQARVANAVSVNSHRHSTGTVSSHFPISQARCPIEATSEIQSIKPAISKPGSALPVSYAAKASSAAASVLQPISQRIKSGV